MLWLRNDESKKEGYDENKKTGQRDYKKYCCPLVVQAFHIVISLNLAHEGISAELRRA
jgi:hypothetical protein